MVDAGERADVVLEQTLARSGYLAELEASDDPQDETRVENLAELVAVAREFADEPVPPPSADPADLDPGPPGVPEFLERVALVADSDQIPDQDTEDTGVVTLMTLHTAKGLEFPVVFLTGLEDGVFPHMRSLGDQTELEEERRLAYVGAHPRPAAALRLPRRRPLGLGRAVAQPRLPVPRRGAGRPRRLAPHRGRADVVEPRRCCRRCPPRNAGARHPRFGTSAIRADAERKASQRAGARCRPWTPATGSATTRSAWAPSSPSRARRQGRRVDRLRLPGRQAAAAALRPRREALSAARRAPRGVVVARRCAHRLRSSAVRRTPSDDAQARA